MPDDLSCILHAINFLEEKGCRPYLVLKDTDSIQTQPPFNLSPFLTKAGELVLNVSQMALGNGGISVIDDDHFCFQPRFNGVPVTLTVGTDNVIGVYTPDSDEANKLLAQMQAQDQLFNNRQKLDFIQAVAAHYGKDASHDILITVHTDSDKGPDTVYPIYDPSTGTVEIIDEEDDTAKALVFDEATCTINPGGFSIGVVIVEDIAKRRVLAFTDTGSAYVFDQKLADVFAQVNAERLERAEKREADVIDFRGQRKETNPAAETKQSVLNLGNVVDMNLFRNKNR